MTADQIAEERPLPLHEGNVQRDIAALRSKMTELEQQARTLIRQRPVVAVLAAAGIGYVVARVVVRGTR